MNAEACILRMNECLADEDASTGSKVFEDPTGILSRSQRNIREWEAYLPKDCVASMIAMGWDATT